MRWLLWVLNLDKLCFEQMMLLSLAGACGLLALQEFAAKRVAERRQAEEAVRPGGSAYAETERAAPRRSVTWFPAFDRTGWMVLPWTT